MSLTVISPQLYLLIYSLFVLVKVFNLFENLSKHNTVDSVYSKQEVFSAAKSVH
jgi:hypothetical protein